MRPDPLSGFTIGVTADRRSDEQIRLLTSRGASVMHGAVIKTHPLGPEDDLRTATQRVIDVGPDVIVLTTGVGVRGWLEAADAAQLGDSLRDVFETSELFARGPKAVGALATAGFSVTWRAQQARYSDVVAGLLERGVQGATVAVQLDGAGAGELCDEIEALGATVVKVPVYRWSLPEDLGPAEKLIRAVIDRRVDALTFTAKPAVENFFEIAALIGVHGELIDAVSSSVGIFCVGPVCATGFTNLGLHVSQVPDKHRLGALVQMVAGAFAERSNFISIGGVGVRLQGRYLTVDGSEPVALTERERSVLSVLLEKPGAVYSKTVLLKRVWHDTESDEHVVEVTMARLRQRLGIAAPGIETVIRRGYRLSAA